MRRPEPLPARPPGSGEGDGTRSGVPVEPAAPQSGVSAPPSVSDVPSAPSPSGAPERADSVPAADGDAATALGSSVSTAHEAVGLRGVWRASRARRRALRAEVRRFTAHRSRRRWTWIVAVGAVLLVGIGSVAAAYSPLFGVETITVTGTSALDPAAVEQALSGQRGTPLASVDESAVKAALVGFPLVESYRIEARPPHELVVRIVERTPVGAIAVPAGFSVVDAAGVVLSTSAALPAGVAEITVPGGIDGPVFAAAARVVRALPDDIRTRLATVSATTPNDVTLTLAGRGTRIVWGSADDSARKAVVLATTMAARPADTVQEYDVSTPAAVVVR